MHILILIRIKISIQHLLFICYIVNYIFLHRLLNKLKQEEFLVLQNRLMLLSIFIGLF